jgi:hypothetical protein
MEGRTSGNVLTESLFIAFAVAAIAYLARQFGVVASSAWWLILLSIIAGWFMADIITATAHWAMDTWGSEETPVIGKMFILNFRIHHTDQLEMTRHGFLETNGNNALTTFVFAVPFLFFIPPNQALLAFIVSTLFGMLVTNQIHQWAHAAKRPAFVTMLQNTGLILPRAVHGVHHSGDHTRGYGITNGWSHGLLDGIKFFRAVEFVVTAVTGVKPRKA